MGRLRIWGNKRTVYLVGGGDDEPAPIRRMPISQPLSRQELQKIGKAVRDKFPEVEFFEIRERRIRKNPFVSGEGPIPVTLVLAVYILATVGKAALNRLGQNIGDYVSRLIKVLPEEQSHRTKKKRAKKPTRSRKAKKRPAR
jgi:hypothetical protein